MASERGDSPVESWVKFKFITPENLNATIPNSFLLVFFRDKTASICRNSQFPMSEPSRWVDTFTCSHQQLPACLLNKSDFLWSFTHLMITVHPTTKREERFVKGTIQEEKRLVIYSWEGWCCFFVNMHNCKGLKVDEWELNGLLQKCSTYVFDVFWCVSLWYAHW